MMAPAWTDEEGSDVIRRKNALESLAELEHQGVYVTFSTEWRSLLSHTKIVP